MADVRRVWDPGDRAQLRNTCRSHQAKASLINLPDGSAGTLVGPGQTAHGCHQVLSSRLDSADLSTSKQRPENQPVKVKVRFTACSGCPEAPAL